MDDCYDSDADPKLPKIAFNEMQKKKILQYKKLRSTLTPAVVAGKVDKRDATESTLRGSYYQAAVTVLRWIKCKSNEHVLIEFGEDITSIFNGMKSITKEQQAILNENSDEAAIKAIIDEKVEMKVLNSQVKVHGNAAGEHKFNLHSTEVIKFLIATVEWIRDSNLPKSIRIASEFHTTSAPNEINFESLFLPEDAAVSKLVLRDKQMRSILRWNNMNSSSEQFFASPERKQDLALFRYALLSKKRATANKRAKRACDEYPRSAPARVKAAKWNEFCEYIQDDKKLGELIRTVRFNFDRPGPKLKHNFLDVRQACIDALKSSRAFRKEPVALFNHLLEIVISKCFESRLEISSEIPDVPKRKILSQKLLLAHEKECESHSRNAIIDSFTKRVLRVEYQSCREYIQLAHTAAQELLKIPVAQSYDEDESGSLIDAWGASMLVGQLFRQYGNVPSPNPSRSKHIQDSTSTSYDRAQPRISMHLKAATDASAPAMEEDEKALSIVESQICQACSQPIPISSGAAFSDAL